LERNFTLVAQLMWLRKEKNFTNTSLFAVANGVEFEPNRCCRHLTFLPAAQLPTGQQTSVHKCVARLARDTVVVCVKVSPPPQQFCLPFPFGLNIKLISEITDTTPIRD